MENREVADRLIEERRDAWQRASRSQDRQVAHAKWHRQQDRIAALKAAREAEQATITASNTEESNIQPSNSTKVSLSGIAACIAKYESGGNPTAQNPTSSASGLYQFIDGTWNNYGGYSRAMYAPVSVQTEKFYQVWNGGAGAGNWVVAYRCGY